MEIDQVQGGFDNLKKVCYFQNAAIFQHDCHMPCICICPGWWSGVLRRILTGVCGMSCCNRTLGYGDRGPKSYAWLWKMGQNQTLDTRKCHQINHFWSNFACNWSNLAQILSFASKKCWNLFKFAENISLAAEDQPKLEHWLRKSSQK